jgi:hypothetical protein
MMIAQTLRSTDLALDQDAVTCVAVEEEAPLSDAPLPAPEGAGLLLLALLLSPQQPKEPKRR